MNPDDLQRVESLYNEALSLSPAERSEFLNRVCGDDLPLRKELESLLSYEKQAESYLEQPAFEDVAYSLSKEGAGILVDRMVGRYQLLSLVGKGGMADVYCAVDTRLNRLVAVKTLPEYMANSEALHRFELEARTIAALNHPNICMVHDVGHDGGLHYLVFEYLVGQPLSDRLAEGALTLRDALQYAIEIADALTSAHEAGVIHLDLKPENIMLTRTGAKLLDFGIAELRYPDGAPVHSATDGGRPGTLGYMAPEQLEGGAVDSRTDIFAFGAVLYHMLTGRAAFPARDIANSPPPVSQLAPQLPAQLDLVIGRCLAHAIPDRWSSIAEVLLQLRETREKASNL